MNRVTRKDVNKLISAPLCFAQLMENEQIQEVIAIFVSVLNQHNRGDQNP